MPTSLVAMVRRPISVAFLAILFMELLSPLIAGASSDGIGGVYEGWLLNGTIYYYVDTRLLQEYKPGLRADNIQVLILSNPLMYMYAEHGVLKEYTDINNILSTLAAVYEGVKLPQLGYACWVNQSTDKYTEEVISKVTELLNVLWKGAQYAASHNPKPFANFYATRNAIRSKQMFTSDNIIVDPAAIKELKKSFEKALTRPSWMDDIDRQIASVAGLNEEILRKANMRGWVIYESLVMKLNGTKLLAAYTLVDPGVVPEPEKAVAYVMNNLTPRGDIKTYTLEPKYKDFNAVISIVRPDMYVIPGNDFEMVPGCKYWKEIDLNKDYAPACSIGDRYLRIPLGTVQLWDYTGIGCSPSGCSKVYTTVIDDNGHIVVLDDLHVKFVRISIADVDSDNAFEALIDYASRMHNEENRIRLLLLDINNSTYVDAAMDFFTSQKIEWPQPLSSLKINPACIPNIDADLILTPEAEPLPGGYGLVEIPYLDGDYGYFMHVIVTKNCRPRIVEVVKTKKFDYEPRDWPPKIVWYKDDIVVAVSYSYIYVINMATGDILEKVKIGRAVSTVEPSEAILPLFRVADFDGDGKDEYIVQLSIQPNSEPRKVRPIAVGVYGFLVIDEDGAWKPIDSDGDLVVDTLVYGNGSSKRLDTGVERLGPCFGGDTRAESAIGMFKGLVTSYAMSLSAAIYGAMFGAYGGKDIDMTPIVQSIAEAVSMVNGTALTPLGSLYLQLLEHHDVGADPREIAELELGSALLEGLWKPLLSGKPRDGWTWFDYYNYIIMESKPVGSSRLVEEYLLPYAKLVYDRDGGSISWSEAARKAIEWLPELAAKVPEVRGMLKEYYEAWAKEYDDYIRKLREYRERFNRLMQLISSKTGEAGQTPQATSTATSTITGRTSTEGRTATVTETVGQTTTKAEEHTAVSVTSTARPPTASSVGTTAGKEIGSAKSSGVNKWIVITVIAILVALPVFLFGGRRRTST